MPVGLLVMKEGNQFHQTESTSIWEVMVYRFVHFLRSLAFTPYKYVSGVADTASNTSEHFILHMLSCLRTYEKLVKSEVLIPVIMKVYCFRHVMPPFYCKSKIGNSSKQSSITPWKTLIFM
jgi:hypothetical protein